MNDSGLGTGGPRGEFLFPGAFPFPVVSAGFFCIVLLGQTPPWAGTDDPGSAPPTLSSEQVVLGKVTPVFPSFWFERKSCREVRLLSFGYVPIPEPITGARGVGLPDGLGPVGLPIPKVGGLSEVRGGAAKSRCAERECAAAA